MMNLIDETLLCNLLSTLTLQTRHESFSIKAEVGPSLSGARRRFTVKARLSTQCPQHPGALFRALFRPAGSTVSWQYISHMLWSGYFVCERHNLFVWFHRKFIFEEYVYFEMFYINEYGGAQPRPK